MGISLRPPPPGLGWECILLGLGMVCMPMPCWGKILVLVLAVLACAHAACAAPSSTHGGAIPERARGEGEVQWCLQGALQVCWVRWGCAGWLWLSPGVSGLVARGRA